MLSSLFKKVCKKLIEIGQTKVSQRETEKVAGIALIFELEWIFPKQSGPYFSSDPSVRTPFTFSTFLLFSRSNNVSIISLQL